MSTVAEDLQYQYRQLTIQDLTHLQERDCLNLEPGFQRKSVWKLSDRKKLIESILEGYPIPSIFLYRREENGVPVYDVIDGKQRLETVFGFCAAKGFKQDGFSVRFRFDGDEEPDEYRWRDLRKYNLTGTFLAYKIQTAEVSGGLSDIIDLFVRINSTGKSLTASERRHARYHTTPLLKEAERLAKKNRESYFKKQQIISDTQVERMKDVELVTELLTSVLSGGPIHRKAAVDRAVGSETINQNSLKKAVREFSKTLGTIKRLFPDLRHTRFHNISEFYTLFLVVWEMVRAKVVLTNKSRNKQARLILQRFSDGVDHVRVQQQKAKGAGPGDRLYVDYLLTVQRGTDQIGNRQRRAELIRGLLRGLFARKDAQRSFTPEQRRLLWNSEEKKACTSCGEALDWNNFEADHVIAHARGGKTKLTNAALLCKSCNASKGARRGPKAKQKRAPSGQRRLTPEMMLSAIRKLRKPTKKELEKHLGFSGLTIHKMLQTLIAKRRIVALDTWPLQYQRRTGGKK